MAGGVAGGVGAPMMPCAVQKKIISLHTLTYFYGAFIDYIEMVQLMPWDRLAAIMQKPLS